MLRSSAILCVSLAFLACGIEAQPAVQVDTSQVQGPRPLEEQTKTAAVRGYLKAWQSMSEALAQNDVTALDADFLGTARDKLAETVAEQAKLGIQTRYRDRSHHIQFVFYSPEGLSIELVDRVDYDVQVTDHGKSISTVPVSTRYVVVLTPAEVQWKVRVMQVESEQNIHQGSKQARGIDDRTERTKLNHGV